jgi:hypothetical protein
LRVARPEEAPLNATTTSFTSRTRARDIAAESSDPELRARGTLIAAAACTRDPCSISLLVKLALSTSAAWHRDPRGPVT